MFYFHFLFWASCKGVNSTWYGNSVFHWLHLWVRIPMLQIWSGTTTNLPYVENTTPLMKCNSVKVTEILFNFQVILLREKELHLRNLCREDSYLFKLERWTKSKMWYDRSQRKMTMVCARRFDFSTLELTQTLIPKTIHGKLRFVCVCFQWVVELYVSQIKFGSGIFWVVRQLFGVLLPELIFKMAASSCSNVL